MKETGSQTTDIAVPRSESNPTNNDKDTASVSPQTNAAIIDRIIAGARWATLFRLIAQTISWICTIVVVRFISSGDYGLNAMLESALAFLYLLCTFGLDKALVRSKTLEQDEVRAAFGWLLIINSLLFLTFFFSSTLIAAYFGEERLVLPAQLLSFTFLLVPLRVIPNALLDRQLKFKLKAFVELAATVTAAITTLILAVFGMGLWALIIGVLVNRTLQTVILMLIEPWFIKPSLDFAKVKIMLRFGGVMALAAAVAATANMLPIMVAGPRLGPEAIGIFVLALQFALLPLSKIMPVLNPIIFPAFSKFQGERAVTANYMEKAVGIAALALLPPMIGLACISGEFVPVVLGEKWVPAIVPLALLSLSIPFRGLTSFVRQVMGGVGHAELTLKSTIINWIILFILIVIGLHYGVMGLVIAVLITEPIITVVTIHMSKQAFDTTFSGIARSVAPAVICSAVMAAAVVGVKSLMSLKAATGSSAALPELTMLIIETVTGATVYASVLRLLFPNQMRAALAFLKR